MKFLLTSPAFEEGQPIPVKYSGEGRDFSPHLKWFDPPAGTKSLALICEDPDAPRGTWTHWVIYNLPAESRELDAGVHPVTTLPNGTMQGANDFDKIGYNGPKPPAGKSHRYFFRLFALDRLMTLRPGARSEQLLTAIKGHVLAEAQLMGTYKQGGKQ